MSACNATSDCHGPLSAVAVAVLQSLYQHRLLSTPQVRAIHAPASTPRHAQALLAGLERRGLARHARGRHGLKLWHLTRRGADAAEATGELDVPRRLLTPEQASGPLQAHTLAVNEVGMAFMRAARQRGDEFGALSWRREVAHVSGPARGRRGVELVIADALLTYLLAEEDGLSLEYRFVELDRATLPLDRLAAKLARYARLEGHVPKGAREPGWRNQYPTFPGLLVVLADRPRRLLERRREAAIALYKADPELDRSAELSVSVCLLEDLAEHGPFAPIFARAPNPERAVNWLGEPGADTSGHERPRMSPLVPRSPHRRRASVAETSPDVAWTMVEGEGVDVLATPDAASANPVIIDPQHGIGFRAIARPPRPPPEDGSGWG